jgi:lysophospholipase L1-like esterase
VDWDFIACSGAITDDVIIDPQRPGDGYAQTDNPKFTSQTNMVTLTIGGNDAGFASVVKNCALSNCLTFSPWDAVFGLPMEFWLPQKIDGLYDEILATYQEIKQKAPDAVVFILTYPQVFPDSVSEQTCIGLRPFNTSEQDFLRAMGTRLNDVIAQAAADAGVHQFDVVQHWADHEVCGNGGQWINGFVSGLPDFKPVGNAAFHPNFKGQYEYSVDLQRGIDGLVDGGAPLAPTGLPQNPAGQIASAGNQAATAATTTDPGSVTDLVVEPVAAPGLRCEGTLALGEQMEATASGFQPSTSVTLTLEQPDASYSRTLATAQSDANGDIDVTATIPTDAPDGMGASIYAVGTNPNGDAHLAYTTAGLAATPPDCDHDAPSITIVAPASGATYQLDEPVDADFSCDDGAGTGVDQCLGSSPAGFPIDTSIPGDHEFTVRASDLEHNVAERTVTYHVDYGIPVANAGIDAVVTDGDRNGSQAVTLDGTGSTSPDGDVISYSWSEGGTHLATGATPTIVLPVGSHTITLTVNDWKGATATDAVAVKVNRPPTANAGPDQTVYDNDSNGSQPAVLNGSGSSDPDGSVATYTWTEGATQIATGVSPTVTLSLGSHTLTLLAADNDGGTATDTVVVTVSPAALAQDTFTRSATAGWGTADFGGAWTVLAGTPTNFSVDGARGVVTAPSGGAAQLIGLVTAVNRDVDMTATVTFPSVLDGEAGFLVVRRQTGGAYYRLGLGVSVPRGKPSALLIRGETNAGTKLFNPFATGLGVAAGDQFRLRIQAQGASPTTLRIRVWRVGTTEPATWAVVTTNKTAAYQTAGSIGAVAFSTSAATVRFDDLVAVKL